MAIPSINDRRYMAADHTQQISRTKTLVQVQWKSGDCHFWASLMKVKHDFLKFGPFIINDGS